MLCSPPIFIILLLVLNQAISYVCFKIYEDYWCHHSFVIQLYVYKAKKKSVLYIIICPGNCISLQEMALIVAMTLCLSTGQLCCAVIASTFITSKSVLCHSFTPVFCLYESVRVHNKMHFISSTAFIWEVKISLILQTIPCSLKVQSISHKISASS